MTLLALSLIELFCEDDEVVSRKTFLPRGITERNEIMLSESHVASMMIVARKVKRSQFKFFDLRIRVDRFSSCKS